VRFWKSVKELQLNLKNISERMLERQPEPWKKILKHTGKICKTCWRVIHWTEIIVIVVEILHTFR